jgi:hypothetical protein
LKGGQLLIEGGKAPVGGGIQDLKQVAQPVGQILAVGRGALFDQVLELAALEDAGVFGKEAEEHPDQVDFQLVAGVTDGLKPVVQPAHAFGGLNVDRVLLLIGGGLIAGHEAEPANIFV